MNMKTCTVYIYRNLLNIVSNLTELFFHLKASKTVLMRNIIKIIFHQSPGSNEKPPEPGTITYQCSGTKKTVSFYYKDCDPRNTPHLGDKVSVAYQHLFDWWT